ncbi:MAG TPA: hypothetical protein VFQ61_16215 [Polyangiaceae bacterium]|nr:hypothetical protein [Polyangiaceae bacterium]
MATWKTAEQLSELYFIGADRLLAYSRRGNLPRTCTEQGVYLFDEEVAACLFRRRSAAGVEAPVSWGVLGEARLGAASPAQTSTEEPCAASARVVRARALRLGRPVPSELARRTGS